MKKLFGKAREEDEIKAEQTEAVASEEPIAAPTNTVEEPIATPAPTVEAPMENPANAVPEPIPAVASVAPDSAANEAELVETLKQVRDQVETLTNEKAQMITMEESIRTKILTEIEAKKHSIENLKAEIPKLKERCEFLANILKIPVYK